MTEHEKRVAKDFEIDMRHAHSACLKKGVYSHIRVNCQIGTYDVVTWPGFLAMSGDMGNWIFKNDPAIDGSLSPDKMALLCVAEDLSGIIEFDEVGVREKIEAACKKICEKFSEDTYFSLQDRNNIICRIQREFASCIYPEIDKGEDILRRALAASFYLIDLFEVNEIDYPDPETMYMSRYTFSFLWACHAIAWVAEYHDYKF